MLPAVALEKIPGLTTRMHGGFRQLLIGDIYNFMKELLKSRSCAQFVWWVGVGGMGSMLPLGQAWAGASVWHGNRVESPLPFKSGFSGR